MKVKKLLIQFFRYVVGGVIAFIVDFTTLSLVYRGLLKKWNYSLVIGTATGFIVGTIVNYCISKRFVFNQVVSRTQSSAFEFLSYAIIGLFGLLLTEVGMYFGVKIVSYNYGITKVIVTGIVLIWNFLARRFLIYR